MQAIVAAFGIAGGANGLCGVLPVFECDLQASIQTRVTTMSTWACIKRYVTPTSWDRRCNAEFVDLADASQFAVLLQLA